jgi:hypothetical protein
MSRPRRRPGDDDQVLERPERGCVKGVSRHLARFDSGRVGDDRYAIGNHAFAFPDIVGRRRETEPSLTGAYRTPLKGLPLLEPKLIDQDGAPQPFRMVAYQVLG